MSTIDQIIEHPIGKCCGASGEFEDIAKLMDERKVVGFIGEPFPFKKQHRNTN
jgi:hypothetical protein